MTAFAINGSEDIKATEVEMNGTVASTPEVNSDNSIEVAVVEPLAKKLTPCQLQQVKAMATVMGVSVDAFGNITGNKNQKHKSIERKAIDDKRLADAEAKRQRRRERNIRAARSL